MNKEQKRYKLVWHYKSTPRKHTVLESDDLQEIYKKAGNLIKEDTLKIKVFCLIDNHLGSGLINIRDRSHKWYQDGILRRNLSY